MSEEARLALEIRDGRPVLLMDGRPLELDEARRLQAQLAVLIKAAEVLESGGRGRARPRIRAPRQRAETAAMMEPLAAERPGAGGERAA
jgi:hypothetical protein